MLFKEAVTKKELARRALEKAAAKAAKEKEKQKVCVVTREEPWQPLLPFGSCASADRIAQRQS